MSYNMRKQSRIISSIHKLVSTNGLFDTMVYWIINTSRTCENTVRERNSSLLLSVYSIYLGTYIVVVNGPNEK